MAKLLLAAMIVALGGAPTARSAPTYFAEANVLNGLEQNSSIDDVPVGATATGISPFSIGGGDGAWSGESAAQAGHGLVMTMSHTSLFVSDHRASLGSGSKVSGAHASLTIDDVVISGPGGGAISGTLNVDLGGSLGASASFANALGSSGSYGEVVISIGIPGGGGDGSARLGASAPPGNTLTATSSGLLTGYAGGPMSMQIESTALPVNVAFSLTLSLQSESVATYVVSGTGPAIVPISAEGFSNYTSLLSFARNGPVFTLPEGFTADSPSGMIVDNLFVPEPSIILLTGPGLLALRSFGSRRRGARPLVEPIASRGRKRHASRTRALC
jgi:hypothetical protein